MSDQNIERVQEIYKAFAKGDIPAIISSFADNGEISCIGPQQIPWAGRWQGKDKMLQFFQRVGENLEILEFVADEYIAQGNLVIALGHERYRVRSDGSEIQGEWAMRWDIRNGKVVSVKDYSDSGTALVALRK